LNIIDVKSMHHHLKEEFMRLSRRGLLKGAGTFLAGATLGGLSPTRGEVDP
jgi:hypothetical protein